MDGIGVELGDHVLPEQPDGLRRRLPRHVEGQPEHELVAPELAGRVLDGGCGEGRLASLLGGGVTWVGVDASPTQLAANPYQPVVLPGAASPSDSTPANETPICDVLCLSSVQCGQDETGQPHIPM